MMGLLREFRRRWWLSLVLLVLAVLLFGSRLATFYTDILWYRSVDFSEVFTTVLLTRLGLGLVAGVLVTLLVGVNLLLARRLAPPYRIPSPQEEGIERYRDAIEPYARPLLSTVAVAVGVLSGLSVTSEWSTFLLWRNGTEFGRTDPQFGLDLGFFVFRLPFYDFVNSWLFASLAFAIVLTAVAHYLFGGIRPQAPGRKIAPQVNVHLSLLLAALVAVRAWGFWLDRYQLSYSTRGRVTGLSYTDANAELPAYQLLTVIAIVCVVLFVLNIRYRNFLLPAAGVGILLVASIVLSGIFPAAIQRFQVEPQELQREEPFITRNLELTRFGFGLEFGAEEGNDVEFERFPADDELAPDEIADNRATLDFIRLWDPSVLGSVYRQLQGLRRYFEFPDVDVDRYEINGRQQQVNVGVRELDDNDLPDSTWQNRHLIYTHGFGLVSSDVSDKTRNGEPEFLVQDIPPTGAEELLVDQPRVYFGQRGPPYSVINTDVEELDYTSNEEGQDTQAFTYDGQDGVRVGGLFRRLAFALRFAEPNMVLSGLLNADSRVLYHRNIEERVESVAPFLQLDADPYAVAVDDRIKWVIDAYTTTDMLPYSTRQDLGALTVSEQTVLERVQNTDGTTALRERVLPVEGLSGSANYIRNSVKAVVDAYDGTIELYVTDPDDPLIQAWDRVFPNALTDVEEASEDLEAHFRYPEDMFRVQSEVFGAYHIAEAADFFTREDVWTIPRDAAAIENARDGATRPAQEPPLRPYYLQLRLPDEESEEFALLQPFNPANRQNLIAYLVARSDPGVRGELRAFTVPESQSIDGTAQVQASINTDGEVSREITLLSQAGSTVRYGNLLTIPVGGSLLYAQPLFVLSQQVQIPELRQVVLVFAGQVVMEPTLEEALVALFGQGAGGEEDPTDPDPDPDQPTEAPTGDVDQQIADLITEALEAFAEAEEALAAGDLGAYQEAINRAEEALAEAAELAGATPTPSDPPASPPATAATPTPTSG